MANMATARLLGVTAFPSLSRISSDFCVNLLICPQLGILFWCVEGREIVIFVSDQAFETLYWVLSVPCKASLLREFTHDTVSDGGEGIQISVSESPGETQVKPLPQVIWFPPMSRVCYWIIPSNRWFGVNFFLFLCKMSFCCSEIISMQKFLSK